MSDSTQTESAAARAASAAAAEAAAHAATAAAEARTDPDGTLLPAPQTAELDAMSLLYLYMSQGRDTSAASSRDAIARATEERHRKLAEIKVALQKALDAAKHGSFWSDLGSVFGKVAKIAALVAAAAATIASAGAAGPVLALAIAALVLSAGAMAQGEFHIFQKLGVSDRAAFWIELGMVAGAALCTGGAALAGGSAATAKGVADLTRSGALIVGGGSSIIAGGSAVASSHYRHDADDANADAERTRVGLDQLARTILELLDAYEESEKSSNRALGSLKGAITIQGDTLVAAARA